MKKWLAVILLLFCTSSLAQEVIHQIPDDGFVEVPLQFAFPYYGQVFTNSWMFDNGVVGFYSPFNGYSGGQNYFSQPFRTELGGQFNYMIAPLWTDLVNYSGTFTTQGDSTFQRYSWKNISQYGYPNNLNTFSLEIYPTGSINVQYDQVNISGYPVSVGTTGNLAQGEFEQMFYASSGNTITTANLSAWSTHTETNMCTIDTLSSPECPGYEEAYFEQQCSFDVFYNSQCPGYEVAYFDQQCSLDALYDSQCPGYEVAYLLKNPIIVEEAVVIQEPVFENTYEQQIQEATVETEIMNEIVEIAAISETVQEPVNEENSQETEKTLSPSLLRLVLSLASDAGPVTTTSHSTQQIQTSDQLFGNNDQEQQESSQLIESNTSLTNDDSSFTNDQTTPVENTDILMTLELLSLEQSSLSDTQTTEVDESEINISSVDQEAIVQETTEYVIALSQQQQTNNISAGATTNNTNIFSNNTMQQILALGGNITEILNTPVPDFSRFDIKPATQDEQVQAIKVENTIETMSQEDIELQAQQRIGSMDPTAQAITLQLMGYKAGFDQYGGTINDQNNWYQNVSVYNNNNRLPSGSNLLFGAQDQKHQELMSLQYRR